MINLSIYDYLEKVVKQKQGELTELKKMCGCEEEQIKLGINSLQSIIRSSVIEEEKEEQEYSRVTLGKSGYESLKLGNVRFDIENVISLISNLPGVMERQVWAVLLFGFSLIASLRKMKVALSPMMGIIVVFLYRNGCLRKNGKRILEEELKSGVRMGLEEEFKAGFENEFISALEKLDELKVIEIVDGGVWLLETVKL